MNACRRCFSPPGATLAAVLLAGSLAGCAAGGPSTTGTTASVAAATAAPTGAPVATPTSRPTVGFANPASGGAPTPDARPVDGAIVGRAVCNQTVYATPAGPGQWRDSTMECTVSSPDSRIAGAETVQVNLNMLSDERAFIWGTTRLETSAGSWEGRYAALADAPYPEGTHHIGAVLVGNGAHAGQRLSTAWITAGDGYDVLAWIEPAK